MKVPLFKLNIANNWRNSNRMYNTRDLEQIQSVQNQRVIASSSVVPEPKAAHLEEAHNSESVVVALVEVDSATEWVVEPVQWVGLAV